MVLDIFYRCISLTGVCNLWRADFDFRFSVGLVPPKLAVGAICLSEWPVPKHPDAEALLSSIPKLLVGAKCLPNMLTPKHSAQRAPLGSASFEIQYIQVR